MTRAEQLRLVADVVELLDERFPDKFEAQYRENMVEARGALGAKDDESVADAARRVMSDAMFVRSQLSQATPYADEVERLHGELKKSELSCEGERVFRQRAEAERDELREKGIAVRLENIDVDIDVRAALGLDAESTTTTLDAVVSLVSSHDRIAAELAAAATTKMQLAEANYAVTQARDALQCPAGEYLHVIAEKRMTSIRDLVQKADAYDKRIAEALLGMYPGNDAPTAVKKLVDSVRRLTDENEQLRRKLESYGV